MVPINKEYLPINWTEELFLEAIDKSKGIKNLVKEYYKQARLIAQSEAFECIAHFDLIKCWNKDSKYFSDKEDWYKYEVLKTLDEISKSKISIEINTSNWRDFYPCEEQCPSLWILQEAKKRNIPITIGSDGHKKEHIGTGLERAIILAKQAGYISILKFKKRKPIQIPI